VNLGEKQKRCSKLTVINVAPFLGEAVRRIHYGESLSILFTMQVKDLEFS